MKLGPYPLGKMWVELLDIQPMKCVVAEIYDIHLHTRYKIGRANSKKLRHHCLSGSTVLTLNLLYEAYFSKCI